MENTDYKNNCSLLCLVKCELEDIISSEEDGATQMVQEDTKGKRKCTNQSLKRDNNLCNNSQVDIINITNEQTDVKCQYVTSNDVLETDMFEKKYVPVKEDENKNPYTLGWLGDSSITGTTVPESMIKPEKREIDHKIRMKKIKIRDKIEIPYICSTCGTTYKKSRELEQHARIQHPGVVKIFKCNYCQKTLARSHTILSHIKGCHNGSTYTCKLCKKQLGWSYSLKVHMKSHRGEKDFECSECSKKFTTNCGLKVHMRIHTGEKPYMCDTCGTSFNTSSSLNMHRKMVHEGKKRIRILKKTSLKCDHCEETFVLRTHLVEHLRNHELEAIQSRIVNCNSLLSKESTIRYTKEKSTKKVEVETLTAETARNFCQICNKTFRYTKGLTNHVLIKHNNDRKYKCVICDKAFVSGRQLIKHNTYVHLGLKNFCCEYCGNKYHCEIDLRNHIRIHTDEKPLVCGFCDKRFRWITRFKEHLNCHKNGKVVTCVKCQKEFVQRQDLKKHVCKKQPVILEKNAVK